MASERRPRPDDAPPERGGERPAPHPGEALRDFVVDKVAEKISEKISEKADKHVRLAAKAAARAEVLDRISSHLGALDLWTRCEPAGRRPRFSRDEIAAAAIRIADTEGFSAVSMRRLAAELDAGTMTLYHYVRTKDELLSLLIDAVMSEVVLPDDVSMPADWREATTLIAERSLAALRRHPWTLDITDDPALGPNSVRHFDQSLQALASLQIPLEEKVDILSVVDEYVFGFVAHERTTKQAETEGDDGMVAYVEQLLERGTYPQLRALADDVGLAQAWGQIEARLRDPGRFRRNLDRLLDGIAADLAARAAG